MAQRKYQSTNKRIQGMFTEIFERHATDLGRQCKTPIPAEASCGSCKSFKAGTCTLKKKTVKVYNRCNLFKVTE